MEGEKSYDNLNRRRKTFLQNSAPIYDKNPPEIGIEGTYLNRIQVIYDKPTANIVSMVKN